MRAVSGIILALLFVGMLTLVSNVQPVKAAGIPSAHATPVMASLLVH